MTQTGFEESVLVTLTPTTTKQTKKKEEQKKVRELLLGKLAGARVGFSGTKESSDGGEVLAAVAGVAVDGKAGNGGGVIVAVAVDVVEVVVVVVAEEVVDGVGD
jgi:hypothetical protein